MRPFNSRRDILESIALVLVRTRLLMLTALLCVGVGSAQTQATSPALPHRSAKTPVHAFPDQPWWKHAIVYEIYPRSFQDSNGDGIGDLNGITQRLDYLAKLGIDAIWIAPMFPSPQVDFGYDISDYNAVDPQYGTLADFDRLVAEAKKRNIRILLDMVLNHTSEEHRWFQESSLSRSNPKSDWFMWNDGKRADAPDVTAFQKRNEHDGMVPPNNWISQFGGSAWEWVPARKQFYYHNFYKQQPDLNWSNPAVESAMFKAMQFWLDRGVAGFRLDAITNLFEDADLRDNPLKGTINAYGDPAVDTKYTNSLPEVHAVLRRMRVMSDRYPGNRVLIGETYLPDTAELDKWYGGAAKDELHLPMDMLVGLQGAKLNAADFRRHIDEVETQVHGSQPMIVFNNHDRQRSWDRLGDGTHNIEIAKQISALLLTVRGTPLMYYGEEIGMVTTPPTRVEDVKDPIGVRGWPKQKGRDGERTPMQWDSSAQSGFSPNPKTWLPLAADYTTRNVKAEESDSNSLLRWYERLIALRRSTPALTDGDITMIDKDNPDVLSYVRIAPNGSRVLVALNMSAEARTVSLDVGFVGARVQTLMASDASLETASSLHDVVLPPFSSWIATLDSEKRTH